MVHNFVVHKFVYQIIYSYLCTIITNNQSNSIWKKLLYMACQ